MENINKRTEKSVLIYDYTNKIEQKVNELFEEYSDNEKEKVLFLLYLINKNTKSNQGYQIHSSNHKKFFGFAGNKGGFTIQIIKNILVTNNVIVQVGNASTGIKSNKYSINNTFSWEVNKGNVKIAYERFENITDKYLKKYVADGFVVKADTAYTDDYIYQEPVQSVSDEVEENINDFKMKLFFNNEKLEILEEENRLMKIAIEELQRALAGLITGEKVGELNTIKEEPEKFETADIINTNIEYNEVELSQPVDEEKTEVEEIKIDEEEKIETNIDDDLMNKSLLVDDLEDLDFNEKVKSWDEQQALKEAEENKIFDLNKYKNNLSVELTENITNVVYRYTKSKSAVDKVIKIMNEKNIIEKSDLMCFGVSGAIVNMMFNDLQKIA